VQTGETAFEHVHGQPLFRYLKDNPQLGELFHQAMVERTVLETAAILDAYDFSGVGTLVDVGGGRGSLLAAILGQYRGMHGGLVEVPPAVAAPDPRLVANGIGDRCELVGGDFFAAVPAGADAYVLKSII